jgi:hypothetical protein
MKKILSSMMVAGLVLAGAACGGDDGDAAETDTTEASTDAGGDSGGDAGGSSEVEEYCTEAEALGEELAKVMEDPMSGDVAALTAQANELVAAAAALSGSNADDVERINECSAKITAALGG